MNGHQEQRTRRDAQTKNVILHIGIGNAQFDMTKLEQDVKDMNERYKKAITRGII